MVMCTGGGSFSRTSPRKATQFLGAMRALHGPFFCSGWLSRSLQPNLRIKHARDYAGVAIAHWLYGVNYAEVAWFKPPRAAYKAHSV